jgi:hypothetical protein
LKRILFAMAVAGLLSVSTATVFSDTGSRFPISDPNPRVGTPNDPEFDCAESDDEDPDVPRCSDVFAEQWKLFGFAPDATEETALYHDAAHLAAGQTSQISGVSADLAWKTTIGRPDVAIAILDTGIRWDRGSLRLRIWLNRNELPLPRRADGTTSSAYDANGDGAFNVADYDGDSRVNKNGGPNGIAGVVDGQDLIRTFSNGSDADRNGYVDDIAGWDWFDDDNDAYDASSYSSAGGHGSGRAEDAAEETNDGLGGAGMCPRCQVMTLRVWDTFVAPGDTYAMATLYAADNGASVQEVALGVLQNSRFAQAATQYAFDKGLALMQVSSDLNTSSHNYPTNYNNTIFVAGSVADTHGVSENNAELASVLQPFGVGTNAVSTWFRNSNLTQFGGHAHIVMMGDTGSQATGQASGAAGLVVSRGLELASQTGGRLTANEIKQILTGTAEDVLPENTVGSGIPDPAQPGWDQHFGYGRVNLAAAVNRIGAGKIPPEAGIESPAWFAPLDPVTTPLVPISGYVSARRATSYVYQLEYAMGLEPLDAAFIPFASGGSVAGQDGQIGVLPLSEVAALMPGAAHLPVLLHRATARDRQPGEPGGGPQDPVRLPRPDVARGVAKVRRQRRRVQHSLRGPQRRRGPGDRHGELLWRGVGLERRRFALPVLQPRQAIPGARAVQHFPPFRRAGVHQQRCRPRPGGLHHSRNRRHHRRRLAGDHRRQRRSGLCAARQRQAGLRLPCRAEPGVFGSRCAHRHQPRQDGHLLLACPRRSQQRWPTGHRRLGYGPAGLRLELERQAAAGLAGVPAGPRRR